MISERQTKRRIAFVLFLVLAVAACVVMWRARADELGGISARIARDQDQIDEYTRIIGQKRVLLATYRSLSARFLAHQISVAGMETSFTRLLSDVCRANGVTFIGVNYGDVDGSAPPAPAPRVDQSGQAVQNTAPDLTTTASSDLGPGGAGDPRSQFPAIPADLFTRVPATVTFKGDWRHLLAALQDVPRRNMLIVLANPDVKRLDPKTLALSVQAQILTPAVTVIGR